MEFNPLFTLARSIPLEFNLSVSFVHDMDEVDFKNLVEGIRLHFLQLHQKRHPVFATNRTIDEIIGDIMTFLDYDLENITRKHYKKSGANILFETDEEHKERVLNEKESELYLSYTSIHSTAINHWFPEIWDTIINTGKSIMDQVYNPEDFYRNVWDIIKKDRFKIYRDRPNALLSDFLISCLRIVNGNQPVYNFPSSLAAWIYKNKAKRTKDKKEFKILDMSMGWAGRFLGALSCACQLEFNGIFDKIYYYGTDVNETVHDRFYMFKEFWDRYIDRNVVPLDFYKSILPAEDLLEDEVIGKMESCFDIMFTSPPYFNKEMYSNDKGQSYKIYNNNYDQWRVGFLEKMISNTYKLLDVGGEMWVNIADVKYKGGKYLPLEKDTVSFAEKIGFKHIKTYKMLFGIMPGLDKKSDLKKVEDEKDKNDEIESIENKRERILSEIKNTDDNTTKTNLRSEYTYLGKSLSALRSKKNKGLNSNENPKTKNVIDIGIKRYKFEPIFVFRK